MDRVPFWLASRVTFSTQVTAQSYLLFLPFFLYLEPWKPFLECHECFGTTRHLAITTFVCSFHLYKIVIIAMELSRYIGIFEVLLPSSVYEESTRFR